MAAKAKKTGRKATGTARRRVVAAWEDDPLSGGRPQRRPVPDPAATPLPFRSTTKAPAAKVYSAGTPGFRYWTAAEALRRAADFWGGLLPPGTNWQPGDPLRVDLDQGVDLNAYYDRQGLSFFHQTVKGKTLYSGESPDVVCHELGHAVLDAVRPELWDAMSDEVASFHESFGDMSALLSGLQLPSLRQAVLQETGGKLYHSSRLSRLAEQLGWGIRQMQPDAVDSDCLRNAVNSLFYASPTSLPPSGPASTLSSEPHSFSRVFTGGFFEALGGMLAAHAATPTADDLLQVSQDAGRLLIDAVSAAPVVPDYYSQVAAHMVAADQTRFTGKYGEALRSAFVRRGILSIESAGPLGALPRGTRAAAGAAATARITLPAGPFGLGGGVLVVQGPGEARRYSVTPAVVGHGATPAPRGADEAARTFALYLFRRGRVDLKGHGDLRTRVLHPQARKTHELVVVNAEVRLVRRTFDCGFDCF
jgi:hypothetical protein